MRILTASMTEYTFCILQWEKRQIDTVNYQGRGHGYYLRYFRDRNPI